jgi:hypothetical protein
MSRIRKIKAGQDFAPADRQKKSNNKAVIFTIILAGIMIFSVFGIIIYGYSNAESSFIYNKHTFKRSANGWTTKIDGKNIEFNYPPDSVDKIALDPNAAERILSSRMVYVTVQPDAKDIGNYEALRLEFMQKFPDYFSIYVVNGITKENPMYNQQIITCANATNAIPVIYLGDGNDTSITMKGNCIIFSSDQQAGLALKDRLLYALFKII